MIKIIETKINLTGLNNLILKKEDLKYLIMNRKTLEILSSEFVFPQNRRDLENMIDYAYGTYMGVPIAICEKLKDGEVDAV